MKFINCLAVCTLIFASLSGPAFGEDLLKELDSLMAPGPMEQEQGQRPILDQVFEHLDLALSLTYKGYLDSKPGYDDNEGEAMLKFNTWTGGDSFSFHVDGWAEYGTMDDTWAGVTPVLPDNDRERRFLEISQVYGLLDFDNFGLTLGKKILPENTNAIVPVSQVYHPLDLNDPADYRTLGVWQVTLDKTLGDQTEFRASVFPAFQDPKLPSSTSRWMDNNLDESRWYSEALDVDNLDDVTGFILYYFGDVIENSPFLEDLLTDPAVTVVTENDRPDNQLDEMGYSGLVKSAWGDLDLFSSIYYGPNPYPLVYVEDRGSVVALIKKNPNVARFAGGGTYTWESMEFHGEVLYNLSSDHTDDDYISYVGGVTITDDRSALLLNIDQIHWRLNWAGEIITSHQDAQGYYFSSEVIRPFTGDLLLQLLLQINPDLTLYYHMDLNFDDNAQYHRLGGTLRLAPGLTVDVKTEFFDGDDTSFIGLWRDNDRISCNLTYHF